MSERAAEQIPGINGHDAFELKKEVINGIRSWVDSEKQFVFLIIAFNLAISSLVLSEKVFAGEKSYLVGGAVGLFLLSAVCYFWYYHTLHMAVREVLLTLETLDVSRAKQLHAKPWEECKHAAIIGVIFTFLGLFSLFVSYFSGTQFALPG